MLMINRIRRKEGEIEGKGRLKEIQENRKNKDSKHKIVVRKE